MDLTTTMKIKRRVLNIEPQQNKEQTPVYIKTTNWTKQNLQTTKFKVSSFFFNNSEIPCFIPKWIQTAYTANQLNNKTPSASVTFSNSTITNKTLDYFVAIKNKTTNDINALMIEMHDDQSRYPNSKPLSHLSTAFEQYNNRYYHFYNTTNFCSLVQDALNVLLNNEGVASGLDTIKILRTDQGYAMYFNSDITAQNYEIQFSKTLIDLFQFKNTQSLNSTYLYTIQFNESPVSYFVPTVGDSPFLPVYSTYIPDKWFPYDLLIIKSDIPVETEIYYNNTNYLPSDYDNIILTFKVINNNPDGIYNYFTSEIDPNSGWMTMTQNTNSENIYFTVNLRLRETNDLVNYVIGQGEKAYILTETIITE